MHIKLYIVWYGVYGYYRIPGYRSDQQYYLGQEL